jgi:hypothetical protein
LPKLYITPFINESISDNPLKQKKRTYPIDMIYPQKKALNSVIFIPEGYKVDFLPQKLNIDNKLFKLNYFIVSDNEQIKISFEYYFKQSVYPVNNYSLIKYYFNEIVKKGNEKIVLSKIL